MLDDGVQEEEELAADALRAEDEANGDSYAALGESLVAWSALGRELEDRLTLITDFKAEYLTEASELGTTLLGLVEQARG